MRALLFGVVLSCLGLSAHGHQPMNHDCQPPVRPADDQNDEQWARFLTGIDAFQTCITETADRHQAASDAHQRAAFSAVDLWNDFVRTSLNAPEDYPWPPDADQGH